MGPREPALHAGLPRSFHGRVRVIKVRYLETRFQCGHGPIYFLGKAVWRPKTGSEPDYY